MASQLSFHTVENGDRVVPMLSDDDWSTPPEVARWVGSEFGPVVDVSGGARGRGYVAFDRRVTLADYPAGGLDPDCHWDKLNGGGAVFFNPPYSDIGPWAAKADREIQRALPGSAFVALLPANRTGCAWWHQHALRTTKCWVRGRVDFMRTDGTRQGSPNHNSVFVVWTPGRVTSEHSVGPFHG